MVDERHLSSLRDRLGREVERLEAVLRTVGHGARASERPAMAEEAGAELAVTQLGHRRQEARERLAEVRAALDRLDDGTYGTCETCGGDIDDTRLLLEPTTRACQLHGAG